MPGCRAPVCRPMRAWLAALTAAMCHVLHAALKTYGASVPGVVLLVGPPRGTGWAHLPILSVYAGGTLVEARFGF